MIIGIRLGPNNGLVACPEIIYGIAGRTGYQGTAGEGIIQV